MVAITVLPFLAYYLSILTILSALKLSKAEVGSSNKSNEGSVIISTPIAVLFLSPPDIDLFIALPIWTLPTL